VAKVLIVGAGPAGAGLALALARLGQGQVELLEAAPDALGRFRGEGLMPSGLEALDRLGVWPLPASVPHRPLTGWSFSLEGRPLFAVDEPFDAGPACHLVDQPALLRHLLDQAAAAGCRLHLGAAVVALVRERNRVCGVELADGCRLAADLVVACDGRRSTLRRPAGLPLEEAAAGLRVLWFRLSGPAAEAIATELEGRFVTVIGSGDSWGLFASARGGLQLGWLDRADGDTGAPPSSPGAWRERWASAAPPVLASLLRELEEPAIEGPLRLAVKVGLAPRWHAPGLLLLGDAAHPMSPLRAQGLNMALRDAVVAAERLGPLLATTEPAAIDAAAASVTALRLPELQAVQQDQRREAARAELLRRQGWLRALLSALAPWAGPVIAHRWVREQDRLRQGLPLP
jgi:2-polyprenyl-6-methoxyphenol hydroxylase-like FAD-dependent oxidoreductase